MIDLPKPPKALLLMEDGSSKEIEPENGTDFKLKELYAHIGCEIIEIARTQACLQQGKRSRDYIIVIDENGKLKNRQINNAATEWYSAPQDIIVGNAILCHTSMLK